MPFSRQFPTVALVPLGFLLCACGGGGGSTHHPPTPLTNIDLAVTGFTVSPSAADPEDTLTVSGTIQNVGTETANPEFGDEFRVRFNLSRDGTFELNEQGFLEERIKDPIPPGGSLDFSYTAPYGGGDTLTLYADFCTSSECVPPETGVIGVKVDSGEAIREVDEGNNFAFTTIEVAGTRVAAVYGGCDIGTLQIPGCELQISDGLRSIVESRPSLEPATQVMFPNDLQRSLYVTVRIINCQAAQSPSGQCGGSWAIVATTQKPGLEASTITVNCPCQANFGTGPNAACNCYINIRDPAY